jgi:hypothetical protein
MDEKTLARFWSKVDKRGPDDCWPWTASVARKGYGKFTIVIDGKLRWIAAHRVAFFIAEGRWPQPFGCHTCDNPPCCNRRHIFEGTNQDNVDDMMRKGRNPDLAAIRVELVKHPEKRARGERSGTAKINDNIVRAIRADSERRIPKTAIAKKYGLDRGHVADIVNRKRWKHVT